MVSEDNRNGGCRGVGGRKFSTVVPANVTGEDTVHELSGSDLAAKLHYLRGVYYFRGRDGIEGLGITGIKFPMFRWLDVFPEAAGRIRRLDSGRPIVKCNDGGVRIIEADCNRTLDEWLGSIDSTGCRELVSDKVLGPDLYFSPTVLLQFTRFACGGMAVGFSWAHVLGDAVAATNFINYWGQLLGGYQPSDPKIETKKPVKESAAVTKPISIKQVEPVGECWKAPSSTTTSTVSIEITETKLKHLMSKISNQFSPFDAISALIWQCLARVRVGREPKIVSICRNDASSGRHGMLSNEQTIIAVESERSPSVLELPELARMIQKNTVDENGSIEELIDKEEGKTDYIIYGANLTFVDWEEVDFYGLELKGQRPVRVDYSIDGVGDEGAVIVSQGPEGTDGRAVMLILPEDEIQQVIEMLRNEWGIA